MDGEEGCCDFLDFINFETYWERLTMKYSKAASSSILIALCFSMAQASGAIAQIADKSPTFQASGPAVPVESGVAVGVIQVSVSASANGIDYSFKNVVGSFYETNRGRSYIAIRGPSRIIFRLADPASWAFDTRAGPFRLNRRESARFYRVSYLDSNVAPREFVLEATPTGVSPRDSGPNEIHAFDLQVIDVRTGDPATIDPDIKNPPPPPQ